MSHNLPLQGLTLRLDVPWNMSFLEDVSETKRETFEKWDDAIQVVLYYDAE